MMAGKARLFGDDETLERILQSPDPEKAKKLGRQTKNFDPNVWKEHCRQIVTEGNAAKFSQNEDLRAYLLGTEDQVIVEASPHDQIWGIGLKATDEKAKHPDTWQGRNLLGFCLMEVRAKVGGQSRK